jgi:uncharacterized RDD family membrane protein YckC
VLFTLAYFPALRLSLVLVSPYAKADLRRRVLAAVVDGSFVTTCLVSYWNGGSLLFGALGALYLLCRDGIGGQSIGRFVVGQAVVHVDTGQRCRLRGSIARNAIFVVPGANLAALVLETRTLIRDPQGQRLGDRLAQTQVVEGLGARDVVKNLQQWWATFLSELPRARRPGRVVIDR